MTVDFLTAHMQAFMEKKPADVESAALRSLKPGFVVQPRYESVPGFEVPLELRVVTLWGRARVAVWWWGWDAAGQRNERNVWFVRRPAQRGELGTADHWEAVHQYGPAQADHAFEGALQVFRQNIHTIVAGAEAIAAAVGAPFLRSDFFVGSPRWGPRLNEVAYGSGIDLVDRMEDGSGRLIDDSLAIAQVLVEGFSLCCRRSGPERFLAQLGVRGHSYSDMIVSPQPPTIWVGAELQQQNAEARIQRHTQTSRQRTSPIMHEQPQQQQAENTISALACAQSPRPVSRRSMLGVPEQEHQLSATLHSMPTPQAPRALSQDARHQQPQRCVSPMHQRQYVFRQPSPLHQRALTRARPSGPEATAVAAVQQPELLSPLCRRELLPPTPSSPAMSPSTAMTPGLPRRCEQALCRDGVSPNRGRLGSTTPLPRGRVERSYSPLLSSRGLEPSSACSFALVPPWPCTSFDSKQEEAMGSSRTLWPGPAATRRSLKRGKSGENCYEQACRVHEDMQEVMRMVEQLKPSKASASSPRAPRSCQQASTCLPLKIVHDANCEPAPCSRDYLETLWTSSWNRQLDSHRDSENLSSSRRASPHPRASAWTDTFLPEEQSHETDPDKLLASPARTMSSPGVVPGVEAALGDLKKTSRVLADALRSLKRSRRGLKEEDQLKQGASGKGNAGGRPRNEPRDRCGA